MKFRAIIFRCFAGLMTLLVAAAAVGWFFLPKDFEVSQAWTELRRHNMDLATKVKNFIVQSDQDVASIGEKRGLPLFTLKLSRKDIAHFSDLYQRYEDPNYGTAYYAQHNLWRNAKLTYGERTYDIKIKSHGRSPTNHRSGRYISLAIKLPRGESINNSRRFSLLVRDHFVSKKQVIFDVAEQFDLLTNREELVRVRINNWDEKLFYFDRRLNDVFMEANGRPSLHLFGYSAGDGSTIKSSVYTGGPFVEQEYRDRFLQTLVELEYPESQHVPLTDRFVAFNKMLYEERYEDLGEFCDLDYVSSYQAVRLLTSLIGHLAREDNLYVFYDTANGKFYPVITRDSWMEKMGVFADGSAELFVDTAGPWEQPLFEMFSRNLDVRRAAYRKILEYADEHEETLGTRHRMLLERYDKLSYFGWATVGMRNAGFMKDDFTVHNLAAVKYYMDTAKPKMKVIVDTDKLILSIAPQSMAGVQIKHFTVSADRRLPPKKIPVSVWGVEETDGQRTTIPLRRMMVRTAGGKIDLTPTVADFDFITRLNEKSQRSAHRYTILIKLESDEIRTASGSLNVMFFNSITEERIEKPEIAAQFATFSTHDFPQVPPLKPSVRSWLSNHPQLRVQQDADSATIQPGDYTLVKDLILPKNLKLVISPGTTLRLAKDVAICGYRGVDALGTEEQPIAIKALRADEPFGSIGILGDANTVSNLRHLTVEGGRERWVNGVYFSGAMSLHYNGNVNIQNCTFATNHADDGLNVKYGHATLKNCTFRDNAADQVDLDLCQGTVEDCQFLIEARQDANGDGLDLSGSNLSIKGCSFVGFPDKGMSIGEQSRIEARNNRIENCTTGIAVKDSSHAFMVDNQFSQNRVDIDGFQKKSHFSGGSIWLSRVPSANTKIYLDAKSKTFAATTLSAFAEMVNASGENAPTVDDLSVSEKWTPVTATLSGVPEWRIEVPVEPVPETVAP